jgi:hypothetical protein
MNFSRRFFILGGVSSIGLMACERSIYKREEEQKDLELDLGPVKTLLYTQIHIPVKAVLLFRDIDGWSALSTRCTYHGCDLTFQEPILLCPCCKSQFGMDGQAYAGGVATRPLPWVEVNYKHGHLYAYPGKVVDSKKRFTTPEIEAAVRKLKLQIRDPNIASEAKIPDALLGSRAEEDEGPMFIDGAPDMAEP